jgi:nicotinate-nucleotide adenylyltransferase
MKRFEQIVKEKLSAKRFRHTLGVADAAQDLARRYGGDVEKARLAGLLHDLTKEVGVAEQMQFFDEFHIKLSSLELHSPKLWHAMTGAAYAEHRLGIDDAEILQAIRYHTTGRQHMSLMDKILYLEDYIEVKRDFDGVEEVRALLDQGLDAMMLQAMKQTIQELLDKSASIHPDTFACYNQLLSERAK